MKRVSITSAVIISSILATTGVAAAISKISDISQMGDYVLHQDLIENERELDTASIAPAKSPYVKEYALRQIEGAFSESETDEIYKVGNLKRHISEIDCAE